ncbi:unnamed protein product [Schistosoma curassoni]|uniref:Uncharacterized protein n=1 Tax=Schistosoma curassoni TaxID=6186 RepID=A0A183L2D3_9TREM|nr:unnamed protein product [Schistosoma curassoni]
MWSSRFRRFTRSGIVNSTDTKLVGLTLFYSSNCCFCAWDK